MYRTLTESKLNLIFAEIKDGNPQFTEDSAPNVYSESMDEETLCKALKKLFDVPNKRALLSVKKEVIGTGKYELDELTFRANSVLLSDWNEKSNVPKVTYTFKTRILTLIGMNDEDFSKGTREVTYSGDLDKISDKKGLMKMFDIEGFTPMKYEVKEEVSEQRAMTERKFKELAKLIVE